MFENRALRNIFIVTLAIVILFPLINIYYIYPAFTHVIVKNTEDEAKRLGMHISKMYFTDNRPITKEDLFGIKQHVNGLLRDFHLLKLKIFSPSGEILFSTSKSDIGTRNEHDYFNSIVSKGSTFTKVVKKDTKSVEGQPVSADVVETYVPVMSGDAFLGAFELYYDITGRNEEINILIFKMALLPLGIMLAFLTAIVFILNKLSRSMIIQKNTEKRLADQTKKLTISNKELESFAHIASHDLQEPLRKVTAFGERLQGKYADVLDEKGRDYLGRMNSACARMQNLIQSLLMFSRVTTKAQPFAPVDLSSVAKEVMSDLEMRVQETGGRVDVEKLPTLHADPLQMRQLFQNLIGNALKFRKPDQHPVVKVSSQPVENASNGFHQITVEDNGIGFDEKYTERIFGVFQRLHGRQEYEGTGIGLSVCRKIVERHGGVIEAKGSPDKGASFIIKLPVKPQHHETGEETVPDLNQE